MIDLEQAPMPQPSPPPRYDVKAPTHALPPGAVDCHAHVFGSPPCHPLAPERPYDPAEGDLEQYLDAYARLHRTLGFARGVLVHSNVHGEDNKVTCDALDRLGPSYCGIALVTPEVDHATLQALHARGMRGVRLNLVAPGPFDLRALEQFAPVIAELGWHAEILLRSSMLPDVAVRIAALPVPVVLDHMGLSAAAEGVEGEGFSRMLALLGDGRIWVKLSAPYRLSASGPPYADVWPMMRALVAANPEQVVWGTDWPHPQFTGPMPADHDLVDHLVEGIADIGLLTRILVGNPERLYDLART